MLLNRDETDHNVLELILESLRLVVPFHEAEIIIQSQSSYENLRTEKYVTILDDPWHSNNIYRAVFSMNQTIGIEDMHMTSDRKDRHASSKTRAWMGVPLADQNGIIGLLSLSRFSVSPFDSNEKELAQVFGRYINTFLTNHSQRVESIHYYSKLF
jgi:GAF domain-containing protein